MSKRAVRWWKWAHGDAFYCPLGHRLPIGTAGEIYGFTQDAFLRCDKLIDAGRRAKGVMLPRCDRSVYLTRAGPGKCMVIEVSAAERERLENMSSPMERLIYLDVLPLEAP